MHSIKKLKEETFLEIKGVGRSSDAVPPSFEPLASKRACSQDINPHSDRYPASRAPQLHFRDPFLPRAYNATTPANSAPIAFHSSCPHRVVDSGAMLDLYGSCCR